MSGPNKVERVSRRVIEGKLLEALEDGEHVAILASKQDLEDLIAALYGYELGDKTGPVNNQILSWEAHMQRRKSLAEGLSQLLREAFP